MLENTELLGHILDICHQKKSGTLFLTTHDSSIVHLVFETGQIIAMDYGSIRGIEVADHLARLKIIRQDFNSSITIPFSQRARISADIDVFSRLGFRRVGEVVPDINELPHAPQRMYRGHAIAEAEKPILPRSLISRQDRQQSVETLTEPTEAKPKKSVRIYRGQVIRD